MKIESMYHLTLNTGNVSQQHANKMDKEILDLLKPYSSEDCVFNIPAMEGFDCEVKFFENSSIFTIRYNGSPVIMCGVAWEIVDAKILWQSFNNEYNYLVSKKLLPEIQLEKMPELPFLVITILPTFINVPQKWHFYLGDFEQSLGWAILDNAYKNLSIKN